MADERTLPATKSDIADLRSGLRSELHHSADQLRVRMENVETRLEEGVSRLQESIRDSQTEVLKAIYGFTESVQQRFQEMDQMESSLKKRMTIIEGRLLEVEKRLNIPPAA